MEFDALLEQRRSIRRYQAQPVGKEQIEQMIEAAIQAPTWKNSQTGRYHVVMSQPLLDQLKEQGLARFNAENIIFDIQFCRLFRRIIGCKPSCTVRQYRKESHDGFLRNDTDLFELGSGRGKGCHAEIFASCGILFHCRSFCIGGAGLYFFFRTALPVGKNQLEIRTAWG